MFVPPLQPRPQRAARPRSAAQRTPQTKTRVRRRNGCSSLLIGAVAIIFLIGAITAALTQFATGTLEELEQERPERIASNDPDTPPAAAPPDDEQPTRDLPITTLDPFNVLLVGVDQYRADEEVARSDTMIVVHVNPQAEWASMLSIPRDSVTQIPNLGQQKINVAYTYGYMNAEALYGAGTDPTAAGGAMAAETVERFLGLEIDYISQVDFSGFERIVDTVGGLSVDIPQPVLDAEYPTENFGFERIYIPAGFSVLDGQTALRYARSRHGASDFERSCRQQRVLRSMLRQVRQDSLLDQAGRIPELVEVLKDSVATTMPISDLGVLYGLADLARSLSGDRVMQLSINPDNVQIVAENGSDIYWNAADIELLVERLLAGPVIDNAPAEALVRVQVQNGAGVQGLAGRVTQNLAAQGFAMVEASDAPYLYPNSLLIDYGDNSEARASLAEALGIASTYIQATPATNAPAAPANTDLVLVLGQDYQERWATVSTAAPAPTPAPAVPQEAAELPNLPPSCSPDY